MPAQLGGRGRPSGAVTDNWFVSFNDPALDALVGEALAYNADLRIAAARVDAAGGVPRGAKLAAVAAGESRRARRRQDGRRLRAACRAAGSSRAGSSTSGAACAPRSARPSCNTNRRASTPSMRGSRSPRWWPRGGSSRSRRGWRRRRRDEMLRGVRASSSSLAGDRLRVGVGDEYDVALARANVGDVARHRDAASTSRTRTRCARWKRWSAAIRGAPIAVAERLPAWPGDVPVGLPSELLERRPDVVAAERRVAAAFYRIEEAKAARLPRITLVANFTSISSELFVLQDRDNPLFSFGAGLLQPIFLGGLLQSQVDIRTAEQQAAIADYGKVGARVVRRSRRRAVGRVRTRRSAKRSSARPCARTRARSSSPACAIASGRATCAACSSSSSRSTPRRSRCCACSPSASSSASTCISRWAAASTVPPCRDRGARARATRAAVRQTRPLR